MYIKYFKNDEPNLEVKKLIVIVPNAKCVLLKNGAYCLF